MNKKPSSLNVTCPECGHEFELSPAVLSGLREQVQADVQSAHEKERSALKSQLDSFKAKAEALRDQEAELKARSENIDETVESRLKERASELATKAEARARASFSYQLKELEKDRDEKALALRESQTKELEVLREKRKLQEEREQFELSVQKTLDQEREKIREVASKQAAEDQARKLSEKDRIVEGLKKQIDDLRRKVDQGSQQLQGEAFELDIEDSLREAFGSDEVAEVPKGIRGADLVMSVRSPTGRRAGSIAIEIKQTKLMRPEKSGHEILNQGESKYEQDPLQRRVQEGSR